ncbi:metallophosphoesterase [Trichococcus paludicola]|uniref:metallophosphoesterase n=1 Tax=Trichococcus paludicola TaxID=2052942 RepID=UPI000D348D96|nr:metallophosphoesterase [Trichococcus paludicola]
MIKILAVSDSHGKKDILNELILRYSNQVDHFIHCGDSELNSTDLIWGVMSTVMGNCDYDYQMNDEYRFQAGDKNVLVVHGHRHSVRGSVAGLKVAAQQANASLVFYGHTHIAKAEQGDGILFINPGSISQPRGTLTEKTYCIVTLNDQTAIVTYYNDHHQEMVDLNKQFQLL